MTDLAQRGAVVGVGERWLPRWLAPNPNAAARARNPIFSPATGHSLRRSAVRQPSMPPPIQLSPPLSTSGRLIKFILCSSPAVFLFGLKLKPTSLTGRPHLSKEYFLRILFFQFDEYFWWRSMPGYSSLANLSIYYYTIYSLYQKNKP